MQRNNSLLTSDLLDLLQTSFNIKIDSLKNSYEDLLTHYGKSIQNYMARIYEVQVQTGTEEEALLARCAPHYVKMDPISAGKYLIDTLEQGYDTLSMTLIIHGADVSVTNVTSGMTPLDMAKEQKKETLINAIELRLKGPTILNSLLMKLNLTQRDANQSNSPEFSKAKI